MRSVKASAGLCLTMMVAAGPAVAETLHDAIAHAWDRLPQRANLAARQDVDAAKYLAGSKFLPNAPSADGTYVNDKIAGSNYNYITTQVGLSTPVWLPGEGTATQGAAKADADAVAAEAEAQHLALASQVVDLVTRATLAANTRDVSARRLAANRALAADLTRQFRVGEASQSDQLAAQAEASSAAVTLAEADAQLQAAKIALAVVTGSDAVPALDAGPVRASATPAEASPELRAAEQAVEAAKANARLVYIQNRDDPEVGLEGINEKQPGTRWDTRFGVTVHFYFATEGRNAPKRAAAEEAVTQAEVRLAMVKRELGSKLQQAQALLAGAQRGSQAASQAASELERRRGQIERAWRLGEMPLIELVRANAQASDAALARSKAQTSLQAAQLQLTLASGVLP